MSESVILNDFDAIATALASEDTLALDLETSGLSPWRDKIHVIALYGPETGTIGVLHYPYGVVPQDVIEWLGHTPNIVTHNGTQFDLHFLANAGMDVYRPNLYDTLIGEQATLYTNRKDVRVNLADTVKRHLGRTLDKQIDHAGWSNRELDEDQLAYVTGDITSLIDLRNAQARKAKQYPDLTPRCLAFEMELTKPIIQMVQHGMPVDVAKVQEFFLLRAEQHKETTAYLKSVLGDINLKSHPQMMRALEEKFGKNAFRSTNKETLVNKMGTSPEITQFCEALLAYRNYEQRRTMFGPEWIDNYVIDHGYSRRVHGKFWQLGTNTGRFSSSEPNLQQLPKDMRECYGNVPGYVVGKSDFTAIEVRVAAAMSGDVVMSEAINAGEDIHRVVAATAFRIPPEEVTSEQRQIAKALSFTLIFGGEADTFMRYVAQYGMTISKREANFIIENFLNRFTGIRKVRAIAERQAARGYPLEIIYPTGLRRVLADAELRHTTILNNFVQGIAAAGIKYALMECWKAGVSKYLCAVVHDEFVYAAPIEEIEEVRQTVDECMMRGMRTALEACSVSISIGVESTYGPTWKGDPSHVQKRESGILIPG